MRKRRIRVASGLEKADLVLKNAHVINVFSMEIERADIAICKGIICGIGKYEGMIEVDCTGRYIAPGFIDGHIHIESSMLHPVEFSNTVIPHGTTAIAADPHEIANVCGTDGLDFMLDTTKNLILDVYFLLPSCVPSSPFDESGAILDAVHLRPYYSNSRVLGLAELMDYEGTISGKASIMEKLEDAEGKIIDGHAPGLKGRNLCAYLTAGVMSDHECTTLEEALERIKLGQVVMIREGTAAKNLEAMIQLFQSPYSERCILVSDDRHPGSLQKDGHMDYIIRKAVSLGADPISAIKMASYQPANYFGLRGRGAVAPGYAADLVVLSDLKNIIVDKVYKNGKLVAENGGLIEANGSSIKKIHTIINRNSKAATSNKIYQSFNIRKLEKTDFLIEEPVGSAISGIRTISLIPGQIGTKQKIMEYRASTNGIDVEKDILKVAVIERHHGTGHMGVGFIHGYGLRRGAIASSVSHDSHNLIVVGANEHDMAAAANCVHEMQGGYAVVCDNKIVCKLPLPVAGLMSDLPASKLAGDIDRINQAAKELGVNEGIDPFMTIAFVSLPVIPELRISTLGLVNVDNQNYISPWVM